MALARGLTAPGINIRIVKTEFTPAMFATAVSAEHDEAVAAGLAPSVLEGPPPTSRTSTVVASQELHDRVLSAELIEKEMGANELVVRFDNRDLAFLGEGPRGEELSKNILYHTVWEVQIGYPGARLRIVSRPFRFQVKTIRGFRILEVRAYDDAMIRLNQTARHVIYRGRNNNQITRTHVAAAIAKRNGLAFDPLRSLGRTVGRWDEIPQSGVTDAQMLTKLAKKIGFIWYIVDEGGRRTFYFHPRAFFGPRSAAASFEIGVTDDVVEDLEVETDLLSLPRTVIARRLDPFQATLQKYKADNGVTRRDTLGGFTPLDESVEIPLNGTTDPNLDGDVIIVPDPKNAPGIDPNDRQLAEDVDGLFKEFEKSLVKLRLVVLGNPNVRPRTIATLRGLGALSGWYYIAEVRHSITGNTYRTTLNLLKNAVEPSLAYVAANKVFAAVKGGRNVVDDEATPDTGVELRDRAVDAQPPDPQQVLTGLTGLAVFGSLKERPLPQQVSFTELLFGPAPPEKECKPVRVTGASNPNVGYDVEEPGGLVGEIAEWLAATITGATPQVR